MKAVALTDEVAQIKKRCAVFRNGFWVLKCPRLLLVPGAIKIIIESNYLWRYFFKFR